MTKKKKGDVLVINKIHIFLKKEKRRRRRRKTSRCCKALFRKDTHNIILTLKKNKKIKEKEKSKPYLLDPSSLPLPLTKNKRPPFYFFDLMPPFPFH